MSAYNPSWAKRLPFRWALFLSVFIFLFHHGFLAIRVSRKSYGHHNGSTAGTQLSIFTVANNSIKENTLRHPIEEPIHLPYYTWYRDSNNAHASLPVFAPNSNETEWVLLVHLSGNEERNDAIRQTWCRVTSPVMSILFFTGTGVAPTFQAFGRAINLFLHARWFSKFDDDGYVYTHNLAHKLFSLPQDRAIYLGYPLANEGVTFASGGAGYSLNSIAARSLIQSQCDYNAASQYEDVAVAKCLRDQSQIDITPLPGLHPHNPWQMLLWDKSGHPPDHVWREDPEEGYLLPFSYHYLTPTQVLHMHDDFHCLVSITDPTVRRRSRGIPKVIHQFWVGEKRPPLMAIESCRWFHPQSRWNHLLWDDKLIREAFPMGRMINQDDYDRTSELNLKSDIARFEFLMNQGGVYLDADSVCLQPLDSLWEQEASSVNEGFCVYEDEVGRANIEGHMLVATGVLALRPLSPLSILLVRNLKYANYALPAWQSAGPLYATKLFARVHAAIAYMHSHMFYPYHYSDPLPSTWEDRRVRLRDENSYTDQLWGTTTGAYRPPSNSISLRERLEARLKSDSSISTQGINFHPNEPIDMNLLKRYYEVHADGLMVLPGARPRWIVALFAPSAGMCSRMMQIISCLLFAMLTDRVLLFDWDQVEPRKSNEERIEIIGHSSFHDLFLSPPLAFSYAAALEVLDRKHADLLQRSPTLGYGDMDVVNKMRTENLDRAFPQSVVFIERNDWWGSALFHNPHYVHVFGQLRSSALVFGSLFRYMFRPRQALSETEECNWLIQIRRHVESQTAAAPVDAFWRCAAEHGMKSGDDVLVTTDAPFTEQGSVAGSTKTSPRVGCRNGSLACDQEALRTIYQSSKCKHAVLTHTSIFSGCAMGLGDVRDSYDVREDGSCAKRATSDPIDTGLLPGQFADNSTPSAASVRSVVRGAFVFLLYKCSPSSIAQFRTTLAALYTHFNQNHHYPVVLFVESRDLWRHVQFETSVRIHFIEIDLADWAVPGGLIEGIDYPEVWKLRSVPGHKGFNVLYRQMSRYAAGYLYGHPELAQRFDYILKLDADTVPYEAWKDDPFKRMAVSKKRFAFWIRYSDMDDVTDHLWDRFNQYVVQKQLKIKQPSLLLDFNGNYKNTNFYGCAIGASPSLFGTPQYRELFEWFDVTGGWFKYRWDEQKILAFYVALYLDPTEVEYLDYIFVTHQGWASNALGGPLTAEPHN